ncbi:MAG: hypothetical protein ACRDPF_29460 [Streptosporangiaceae bacterium]
MPDDLSSIEGLADKHVRALARQHVTDLRGLVQADPEAIYRAMANLRPRPAREQIARWQDDARNKLATPAASGWQTAASFVVVYSQRKEGDTWERRVEAERTEVEPERTMQVWSGWDAAPVCDWMRGQLDQAADAGAQPAEEPPTEEPPTEAPPTEEPPTEAPPTEEPAAEEPAAEPAPARAAPTLGPASRAKLRIDSAALIDAAGRTEVVTAGALAANPRTELVAPVRVVFAVGGAPPGTPLQAVARIRHPDGPGWNPRDPVILAGPGQVEFDLTPVPAGDHVMALIAWAPDATAKPVSVTLPRVTIRPEPG